eukprot:TRINITY_DN78540_c0_g1_i1.p1 TRINITY_DN78540_c0_g1~~TRINITY_DN78540_c0_g1_i1.p1  ORF type:complete len:111 (+),score=18.81 TRINITY_DN78540_c0_g1_i1:108-440(+)
MAIFFPLILSVLACYPSANVHAAGLRLKTSVAECPLCAAEERCHISCGELKQTAPGSAYCLNACNGGTPSDKFDDAWFAIKDSEMRKAAALDDSIRQITKDLADANAAFK